MVESTKREYDAITRDQFATEEEYQTAKNNAFERWPRAIDNANTASSRRGNDNANILVKIWTGFCEGVKNAGNELLNFINLVCFGKMPLPLEQV